MTEFNLTESGHRVAEEVTRETIARAHQASNALRNAALEVLRGPRSGRRYPVPYTGRKGKKKSQVYYTASAPGEAPAMRTGALRDSWQVNPQTDRVGEKTVVKPSIRSTVPYNRYLDDQFGNGRPRERLAERPYVQRIREKAEPDIVRIYQRPYLGG